jgi:hypothetical protein
MLTDLFLYRVAVSGTSAARWKRGGSLMLDPSLIFGGGQPYPRLNTKTCSAFRASSSMHRYR